MCGLPTEEGFCRCPNCEESGVRETRQQRRQRERQNEKLYKAGLAGKSDIPVSELVSALGVSEEEVVASIADLNRAGLLDAKIVDGRIKGYMFGIKREESDV